MSNLENKLKTCGFWLRIGAINHAVILAVIALGCANSSFTCQGESMRSVLSLYAFTLFTPQIAIGVIIFIALLYVINSLKDLRDNWKSVVLFLGTLSLIILFMYLQ